MSVSGLLKLPVPSSIEVPAPEPVPGTGPAVPAAGSSGRFGVLFVCTGNVCRSVIAERLAVAGLRARLRAGSAAFLVTSAGTAARDGAPPHPHTAAALRRFGVSLAGFTSRRLGPADIDAADLILCVSREHQDHTVAMRPGASRRTFLLREFARLAGHAAPFPPDTGPPGAGPAGPGTWPAGRARHVVAGATRLRGQVGYTEPGEDDIADPRLTGSAYAACADVIHSALQDVLDALCGTGLPSAPGPGGQTPPGLGRFPRRR